jgi:HD-like signal output (HDOD) protein
MTRILFVDDESAFLDSLRSLLRRQQRGWQSVFALGGEQALGEISRAPAAFDVVVTDMRMPRMDGAELLHQVRAVTPGAARLVLSGYAEPDLIARALPVAHQYLTKPCPAAVLRGTLDGVRALQLALGSLALQQRVGAGDQLPPLPETRAIMRAAIGDPQRRPSELADVASRDPALAARLLQLANSALFRPSQPVTSLVEAAGLLGTELVSGLPEMMDADLSGAPAPRPDPPAALAEIHRASLAAARLAAAFAPTREQADLAYTAALLHDIGRTLLVLQSPDEMADLRHRARTAGRPPSEIEREAIGCTHAQVGGYLLGLWGLPPVLVDAVSHHSAIPPDRRTALPVAVLVHAADALLGEALANAAPDRGPPEPLDQPALDAHGFTPLLPTWRSLAQAEAAALATT